MSDSQENTLVTGNKMAHCPNCCEAPEHQTSMKFEIVLDPNKIKIQKATCNHCAHEYTGDGWVSTMKQSLFKVLVSKNDNTVDEEFFTDESKAKTHYQKEVIRADVIRIEVFNPNGAQIADSLSPLLRH
jgi:hypothetical protein